MFAQQAHVHCTEQAAFRDWTNSSSRFGRALESLKSLSALGLASKTGAVMTTVTVGQTGPEFDARSSVRTVKLPRRSRKLRKRFRCHHPATPVPVVPVMHSGRPSAPAECRRQARPLPQWRCAHARQPALSARTGFDAEARSRKETQRRCEADRPSECCEAQHDRDTKRRHPGRSRSKDEPRRGDTS